MTRILSTKKLSKALKNKLSDAKIELVEKNFIQTKSVDFETPQLNDYLVFTSKQALKSVLKSGVQNILLKPCLCVGSKTRSFLEKKGFTVLESADYAEELIQIIDKKGNLDWRYIDLSKEEDDLQTQALKIKQIQAIIKTGMSNVSL